MQSGRGNPRDCFGTVVPRNDRRGACLAMTVCVAKRSSDKLLERQERRKLAIMSDGVKQGDTVFATP